MSTFDEDRVDRFCARAAASGEVWVLVEGEDTAVVESNDYEDAEVMPFWSDKSAAVKATSGEWACYTPQSIPLDEFISSWLPTLDEDDFLVGPDWTEELEGDEVEPEELFRRLETARAARGD